MALGTGHYLCERREVKRMGGGEGRGESRGGQEYFRVDRAEGLISYHNNKWQ